MDQRFPLKKRTNYCGPSISVIVLLCMQLYSNEKKIIHNKQHVTKLITIKGFRKTPKNPNEMKADHTWLMFEFDNKTSVEIDCTASQFSDFKDGIVPEQDKKGRDEMFECQHKVDEWSLGEDVNVQYRKIKESYETQKQAEWDNLKQEQIQRQIIWLEYCWKKMKTIT
jgi:hypothetical protein